ncbi:plasmid recombination protein [Marinomonas sp. C2222]|uniref:Plasmid recombination protein n=1 Tax=Marinomonas sargassi TaxID=2984494 RepID=A0ABT2YQZ5_9GAMM|nr:plasmid recombination protein [Marinomonas sargassi]MCV2402271.1 plasmid recombination protein [Marinomonas sargassi]
MSGYQFIHVEAYSRIPSKNNKKQSAKGMIKELIRDSDACSHVPKIIKPILVHGAEPSDVLKSAENQADIAKDNLGRKFRKDGLILVSGVASYPVRTDEVSFENKDLQKWLKLTIEFLSKKYGDQLKSVVVHSDEPYWHCHFMLVPNLDENRRLDIGQVHDGIYARSVEGYKSSAKAKLRVYSEAMRAFQDAYYADVGIPCGLTRDGPKRRRLTRKEWKIEQEASKRLANNLNRSDSIKKKVKYIYSELDKKRINLNRYEKKLILILKKIGMSDQFIEKIAKKLNDSDDNKNNVENVI